MEARERYKSFLKIWALEVGCQKQKKEAVRLNEAYHQVKPSVLLQKAEMPSQILSGDEISKFCKGVINLQVVSILRMRLRMKLFWHGRSVGGHRVQ